MVKIKKLLDCVCFFCGKLKINDSNERFRQCRLLKDPKKKFQAVWELCKTRTICEAGDKEDYEDDLTTNKRHRSHNGCGLKQPKIKKGPMKFTVEIKPDKEDVFLLIKGYWRA